MTLGLTPPTPGPWDYLAEFSRSLRGLVPRYIPEGRATFEALVLDRYKVPAPDLPPVDTE